MVIGDETKRPVHYNETDKPKRGVLYYMGLFLATAPWLGIMVYFIVCVDAIELLEVTPLVLVLMNGSISLFILIEKSITRIAYTHDKVRLFNTVSCSILVILAPFLFSTGALFELDYTEGVDIFIAVFFFLVTLIPSWMAFACIGCINLDGGHVLPIETKLEKFLSLPYTIFQPSAKLMAELNAKSSSYDSTYDYDRPRNKNRDRYGRSTSSKTSKTAPQKGINKSRKGKYIGSNGEFRINDEMRAYNEDIQQFRSSDRHFDAEEHFGWEQDMSYHSEGYDDDF